MSYDAKNGHLGLFTNPSNFTLQVTAEDGRNGIFDVTPYLKLEAFCALKNKDEFLKIINGKYFIEWNCGADLSADTIEAYLKIC
ncbi:MAG: DUF2442 domain-containing protein [Candidatus Electrothrix sp. GM3_4]|nr:DUF2442 domain-containing protein [Candidatus Electrothrix sp. GM3_4]